MKAIIKQGGHFRYFLVFYDIKSKEDLEILKFVQGVVTRTEYKPFSKGFNKNVTKTYWNNTKYAVPAQFLHDIKEKYKGFYGHDLYVQDEHIIYDQIYSDEYFDEWLDGIILPPNYTVSTPEYIYQKHSVIGLVKERYGRVSVGTGGGKTLISYLSIKYLLDNILRKITQPVADSDGELTIVPNKILMLIDRVDLIIQTKREFEKFDSRNLINGNNYSVPLLIQSIHSNAKKLMGANVIIATWQSIKDYDIDFFKQFKVFISDEAHKAKAYSIEQQIANKLFNIEYSWGFTGTWQKYNTLDYLTVVNLFGRIVAEKRTYELIQDGNVSDVLVKRFIINYNEEETKLIKELKERYKDELTGVELYHLEAKWIQSHDKRNNLIIHLINKLPNNHLILVRSKFYLHLLTELIRENCPDRTVLNIHGDIHTNEREAQKARMANENKMVMIATNDTMSTGVSINNIWYVHNPDGGKSDVTLNQGLGRGLRKLDEKLYAYYFDYVDILEKSSYNRQAKVRLEELKYQRHKIEDIQINLEARNSTESEISIF